MKRSIIFSTMKMSKIIEMLNISESAQQSRNMSVNSLKSNISKPVQHSRNKITIVGIGNAGIACAINCLTLNVADEIALIDAHETRVQGETLDLQDGVAFMPGVTVLGGKDYSITEGSRICIITAGIQTQVGKTRLDALNDNYKIFKEIIPKVVKHNPDVIILIVSNPVDILSYVAWKLSGLPVHKVIGSGTNLDMGRFKRIISDKLKLNADTISMWILGEHGDSLVPIWSSLSVAGAPLYTSPVKETENIDWEEIRKGVVNAGYKVRDFKGYTSWAISLSCCDICKSILRNTRNARAVSTLAKGFYGITDEVFISLPCVLGQNGLSHVINLKITEKEQSALKQSANKLFQLQQSLK